VPRGGAQAAGRDMSDEIERLRNFRTWANGTIAMQQEQMARSAAFLDGLAGRLDNLSDIFARAIGNREPTLPTHAADCRAMARKLRGDHEAASVE